MANLPKLLAQLRDTAHRLGLPPPSARSGETPGNRAPLCQWDTFAHRFGGSVPHSPAWSLFNNVGGLGCVLFYAGYIGVLNFTYNLLRWVMVRQQ